MLCVLSVFVPSFFMVGVGRQLFVPLSLAVGFAMVSSYVLSTTLVPVLATWMMKEADEKEEQRRPWHERYLSVLRGALRFRWWC
jgi:multidrug efflux pump subunit AcrB